MRTLTIVVLPNGGVEFTTANLFNLEHNALEITIDYTLVDCLSHIKRVEVGGLSVPMIYEIPNGNLLTFTIERSSLAGEAIAFQPIAYLLSGLEITQEIKWSILRFPINASLNLIESGEIPPSIATQINQRLDNVENSMEANELFNAIITTPNEGDVIVFDDNKWVNSNRFSLPRWDDMTFELTQTRQGANLKPDYDFANLGLLFPRNDLNEIVYITCQMPHSWVEGTNIFPHVHGIQASNQQATFRIEYKWYNVGEIEPSSWSIYTMTSYAFPYTSGRLGQIIKNDTPISGVGKLISSFLKVKLLRTDNVYVGDFLVDQFDIHIQKDGMGSQDPFDKH